MNWTQRSPHSIQRGEHIVSRARVQGRWIYTLWRGTERVGDYWSADEAKQAAGDAI